MRVNRVVVLEPHRQLSYPSTNADWSGRRRCGHHDAFPQHRSITLQQKTVSFYDPIDAFCGWEVEAPEPWSRATEQPRPNDSRKSASLGSPL